MVVDLGDQQCEATDNAAIEATVATDVQIVAGIGIAVAEVAVSTSVASITTTAMDMETVVGCIVGQCAAVALTGGNGSRTASTDVQ